MSSVAKTSWLAPRAPRAKVGKPERIRRRKKG
jgi:hypothetical protein